MADEERIQELAEAVRYHRELYYNHSAPEISDAEFDALWDEVCVVWMDVHHHGHALGAISWDFADDGEFACSFDSCFR